jgi:hypothetical protein
MLKTKDQIINEALEKLEKIYDTKAVRRELRKILSHALQQQEELTYQDAIDYLETKKSLL